MTMKSNRRTWLTGFAALASGLGLRSGSAEAQSATTAPDLILHNGKITTLDRQNPEAQAVAIRDGRFVAAGAGKGLIGPTRAATKQNEHSGRPGVSGAHDSPQHHN